MKKRGRPKLSAHPTRRLNLCLPEPLYDALCQATFRAGERDIAPFIRKLLMERFCVPNNRLTRLVH